MTSKCGAQRKTHYTIPRAMGDPFPVEQTLPFLQTTKDIGSKDSNEIGLSQH